MRRKIPLYERGKLASFGVRVRISFRHFSNFQALLRHNFAYSYVAYLSFKAPYLSFKAPLGTTHILAKNANEFNE